MNYKNSRIVVGLSCVTRLLNLATTTEGSGSLQVTMVIFCKIAFDHNDYRVAAGGLDSLILYRFNAIELLIRCRFFARFYCFHWRLQISKVIYLLLFIIILLNFSLVCLINLFNPRVSNWSHDKTLMKCEDKQLILLFVVPVHSR